MVQNILDVKFFGFIIILQIKVDQGLKSQVCFKWIYYIFVM